MRQLPPLRGQIWHVWTPGQPHDPHQPRRALILSDDERNLYADDVTLIPIFSRGRPGPTHVSIPKGRWGLEHDSVLFCEEITTLHFDFLAEGPLGTLVPDGILHRAVRAVRIGLGDVVLPGEAMIR